MLTPFRGYAPLARRRFGRIEMKLLDRVRIADSNQSKEPDAGSNTLIEQKVGRRRLLAGAIGASTAGFLGAFLPDLRQPSRAEAATCQCGGPCCCINRIGGQAYCDCCLTPGGFANCYCVSEWWCFNANCSSFQIGLCWRECRTCFQVCNIPPLGCSAQTFQRTCSFSLVNCNCGQGEVP